MGPDNAIVVADSSNHRVQVFDQQGTFVREFGQYGNGEAEFDCLAGVSVNRIGQFIISDRSVSCLAAQLSVERADRLSITDDN